jgi:predicted ribosomally synthesized peptide with SipW-like signal peptide
MDRIRAGEAGDPGAVPAAAALSARRRWGWTARVAAALLLVGGGAAALWTSRASESMPIGAERAPRIAAPALQDLGLDAGCGDGGDCLQLGPCDSPAECGGGPPCSDPSECGGTFR